MKLLTANFITCAVKSCKSSPASFPLHFREATLEQTDIEFNPLLLTNMLPRLEWDALRTSATELGLPGLPKEKPEIPPLVAGTGPGLGPGNASRTNQGSDSIHEDSEIDADEDTAMHGAPADAALNSTTGQLQTDHERMLRELHRILIETQVVEGKMVCGNCGWEYRIKEGIANFLLPPHLV